VVTLTETEELEGHGQATDSVTIDVAPEVSIQGTGNLATTGSLDPSFGTGGLSVTSLGTGGDYFNAVATQKDGKIVAAGGTGANFNEILLARYNTDGSLDTIFGNGGYASTTVPNGEELDNINSVAIDSQGRIVVAGYMQASDGSNSSFLARYLSDGTLDTDFGNQGIYNISTGMSSPSSMAIDGSDGILVAGQANPDPRLYNWTNQLVRITSTGALDTTFGSNGTGVQTNQGAPNGFTFQPSSPFVTIDGQGRILVGQMEIVAPAAPVDYYSSTTYEASVDFGNNGPGEIYDKTELEVACYNSNGDLDPTFGSAGIATMDVGSEADSAAFSGNLNLYGITADNQGGSVMETETSLGEAELVRLTSSGALDTNPVTGFGPLDPATGSRTGIVRTPIFPTTSNDFAVQPDGRMLIFGSFSGQPPRSGWGVARYNPDGSPDSTFGPGFAQIANGNVYMTGVAAESNGNIMLVRYNQSSIVDGSYSFAREQLIGAPPHSPVGTTLSFTSTVNDPNASPTYQWTVTKDGNSYVRPTGTATNTSNFSFTPNAVGTYVVTLSVTDPDGTTVSDSKIVYVGPYVVTTTADSGPGSLRDAINQINADTNHAIYTRPSNPNVDEIDFNITAASDTGGGFNAATGVATIKPLSALPAITNAVILNGYSQQGTNANTLSKGDNAKLAIVLNGANVPGTDYVASAGLVVNAINSTVEGLAINNFGGSQIYATGNNDTFQGNFIGTDISGTMTPFTPNLAQTSASDHAGIQITGSANVIGTNGDGVNDPAERNVIAGENYGVILRSTSHGVVAGNFIGTGASGTQALPNWVGIGTLQGANGDRIGTNGTNADVAGEANIISGNAVGIAFGVGGGSTPSETNGLVAGNSIGLDVNGNPLGNTRAGVFVGFSSSAITIGGNQANLANTIANTQSGPGIWIVNLAGSPTGIRIRGNSIHDNGNKVNKIKK
jgi:uncharacterized delta-60 repeat protein